jgi:hypothetical protein
MPIAESSSASPANTTQSAIAARRFTIEAVSSSGIVFTPNTGISGSAICICRRTVSGSRGSPVVAFTTIRTDRGTQGL